MTVVVKRSRYSRFPHATKPHRLGFLRWECHVYDGYTGPELLVATAWTEAGARRAAVFAATQCRYRPLLTAADVARVVKRLHDDAHIDVMAWTEGERVCVQPLCPCSDRQHRQVVLAFSPNPVRWLREEVAL